MSKPLKLYTQLSVFLGEVGNANLKYARAGSLRGIVAIVTGLHICKRLETGCNLWSTPRRMRLLHLVQPFLASMFLQELTDKIASSGLLPNIEFVHITIYKRMFITKGGQTLGTYVHVLLVDVV